MEQYICPPCPWGKPYWNPRLDRLRHYLGLLDAGCPVGRHELTDDDWLLVGLLGKEREAILAEEVRDRQAPPKN